MGTVTGPASIASVGLGLASGVMSGEGTKAADDMQSAQLAEKAQIGRTAATETNADMIYKLNQSLGNIDAVRAARGDDITSPTGVALRDTTEALGEQERAIRVGNILSQSEMDQAGSDYLHSAGNFALMQGIMSGVAGGAKAVGATDWSKFGLGAS